MTNPVLSICIPTYNRAFSLEKTILSIVSQDYFTETDKIEIVISDNCSSDATQEICQKYTNLYPKKFIYHRNQENILDRNFEKALSLGNGLYLKLCNDTIIYKKNSLEKICFDIEKFKNERPVLLFTAGFSKSNEKYRHCTSFDDFISEESYEITAIGSFGIWKEDFDKIDDFNRIAEKKLAQVDVILRNLLDKKKAVIVTDIYYTNISQCKKGGYNVAEVFGLNFLDILQKYVENKLLSHKTFKKVKKQVFYNLVIPFHFDFQNTYNFNKTGYFRFLKKYYSSELYFYFAYIKILYKQIKQIFHQNRIKKQAKKGCYDIIWRDKNPHNETTVSRNVKIDKISVGNYTYGNINMYHSGIGNEELIIGNYCSIAPEVTFLLASEHGYKTFSTYPFKVKFFKDSDEALSKGSIVVADDVWIGYGATIFSGVTIGQGAIVGAGSIVTKDVPPYAIVAGNPAKILKYRFEREVISELLKLNFATLSKEQAKKADELLYVELTKENVKSVLKSF